jgi:hypothetical protein
MAGIDHLGETLKLKTNFDVGLSSHHRSNCDIGGIIMTVKTRVLGICWLGKGATVMVWFGTMSSDVIKIRSQLIVGK